MKQLTAFLFLLSGTFGFSQDSQSGQTQSIPLVVPAGVPLHCLFTARQFVKEGEDVY